MSTVVERRRRLAVAWVLCFGLAIGSVYTGIKQHTVEQRQRTKNTIQQVAGTATTNPDGTLATLALDALQQLESKGRAPKTGYERAMFASGWQDVGDCDIRNIVLARDLVDAVLVSETDCTVLSGSLYDPYTAKTISFKRGAGTSGEVQIDHVVALSDAWQKGAQELTPDVRYEFANDLLNLLAVDGSINQQKGDGDAATWLPPNRDYRCRYIARQIAVKAKYRLWVTQAEKDAMYRVLSVCPDQVLPIVT